jgi:hypothetical protein
MVVALPAAAQAQFVYGINNGAITIEEYTGPGGAVAIPSAINGLPVTSIQGLTANDPGNVTSLAIPGTVTNIWSGLFLHSGLGAVTVDPLNPVYSSLEGALFDKGQTVLIGCPRPLPGSFTVPNTVTNLPEGVFVDCFFLTAIVVDPLNPVYSSVDGVLFNKDQTVLFQCPRGKTGSFTIPNTVTDLVDNSFFGCLALTNVVIGSGVTSIPYAFQACSNLASVYFQGNAPGAPTGPFLGDDHLTVYYLPGTTGWSPNYGNVPTALWLPKVQPGDASFGVRTNQFGFTINWAGGMAVAVDATTSLVNPTWTPLATNLLTSGSLYFSDLQWTNYPARFYRLRWP